MFNFWDIITNPIGSILPSLSLGLMKNGLYLIDYNNNLIDRLFDNSIVEYFFQFNLILGGILFIGGIGFAFANFTMDNKEDSGAQLTDLIKNVFIGFSALSLYTSVPVLLLKFTNELCQLLCQDFVSYGFIVQMVEHAPNDNGNAISIADSANGSGVSLTLICIYFIIMFVAICRVFFANIKRGGILITLIFVGSFHMFSIPRGYTDAFWSWCKQTAGVCITAFAQNLLVALSLFTLSTYKSDDMTSLVVSIGLALSAKEVPRILQQFGLDTTMKANISQAIFATSGVVSIARTFV